MGKKMILTIEDKEDGNNKADIKFDFFPQIDMKNEANNSKLIVDCFVAITEALGLNKNKDALQKDGE